MGLLYVDSWVLLSRRMLSRHAIPSQHDESCSKGLLLNRGGHRSLKDKYMHRSNVADHVRIWGYR